MQESLRTALAGRADGCQTASGRMAVCRLVPWSASWLWPTARLFRFRWQQHGSDADSGAPGSRVAPISPIRHAFWALRVEFTRLRFIARPVSRFKLHQKAPDSCSHRSHVRKRSSCWNRRYSARLLAELCSSPGTGSRPELLEEHGVRELQTPSGQTATNFHSQFAVHSTCEREILVPRASRARACVTRATLHKRPRLTEAGKEEIARIPAISTAVGRGT
jgi:hypothetical protein